MDEHGSDVGKVAVLSPYKAQVALLERQFRAAHSSAALSAVTFGTIDGFQVPSRMTCPSIVFVGARHAHFWHFYHVTASASDS